MVLFPRLFPRFVLFPRFGFKDSVVTVSTSGLMCRQRQRETLFFLLVFLLVLFGKTGHLQRAVGFLI